MQINYTGHHIDVTPALKQTTEKKLKRLERHYDISKIDVTFKVEKIQQIATATVYAPGKDFHASANSEDMYKAIDNLVHMLERQIDKHKGKESDHRD